MKQKNYKWKSFPKNSQRKKLYIISSLKLFDISFTFYVKTLSKNSKYGFSFLFFFCKISLRPTFVVSYTIVVGFIDVT